VQSLIIFLIVFYCNYVTILHRFQDITTSIEYVTACVTEKSFSIDKTTILYICTLSDTYVNISYFIYATFSEVWELQKRFKHVKSPSSLGSVHSTRVHGP